MRQELLTIARRFAAALDAEGYSVARELLARDYVNRIGDAVIAGQDAIIDSYRANGESAKQRFDSIEYVSVVEAAGPSSAIISFTDRLCIENECLDFRCRQCVKIGLNGLVEEIRHEELPDERERLRSFEAC